MEIKNKLFIVTLSCLFFQNTFGGIFSKLGFGDKKSYTQIRINALDKLESKDKSLFNKVNNLTQVLGNAGVVAFSADKNMFNKCTIGSSQEKNKHMNTRANELGKWISVVNKVDEFIKERKRYQDIFNSLDTINSNLIENISHLCANELKNKADFISSLEKSQKQLPGRISHIEDLLNKNITDKDSIAALLVLQMWARSLEGHFSIALRHLNNNF